MTRKILVAGVGNVLRGDDGFGVRVAQRMETLPLPSGVTIADIGISGISLLHQLMDGYDCCIVVDAADRGVAPGTLFLLQPQLETDSAEDKNRVHRQLVDAHYAEPSLVLPLAKVLGILPEVVYVLTCQPCEMDELTEILSPPMERAVEEAILMVQRLIADGGEVTHTQGLA